MRQLRRPRVADAVADRPHALDARAHVLVDGDAELVGREAGLLHPRVVRDAAGAEEHLVAFERLRRAADVGRHGHRAAGTRHLGDLRLRHDRDPPGLQRAHEKAHELGIRVGDRLGEHLHHRDLGAELRVEGAELETDRAAADDDEPLRRGRERQRGDVVERLGLREAFDRRQADFRSGCASIVCSALGVRTLSCVGETSVPSPLMRSTLRAFRSCSTPATFCATTASLRATAFVRSKRAPWTMIPCSSPCVVTQYA